MTLLTIEKENFLTISASKLTKEDQEVLKDILEKIKDRVLAIEQDIDRLAKPPKDVPVQAMVHELLALTETDIPRMVNSLPFIPKESLTSLRALGACLAQKAQSEVAQGVQELSPLHKGATKLVQRIDKELPESYYLPHEDDLMTLDKQLFASCKRICQALQERI